MPPLAVLVALADPTRCRIIEILRDGAQPVHVLAGQFDISRPAISRHLRVLRQAKLISETKAGRENRYTLHANRLTPVQDWLDGLTPPATPTNDAPPAARPKSPRQEKPARPVVAASPLPMAETKAVPAAPKPAQPVSQMGFDF